MVLTFAVAVPAFNAGPWIAETLDSVLAQTRRPDEVIVVDDGSTDDTATVVEGFSDRGIVLIRCPNRGAPAAYNTAFDAATADYVAMLPADDLWHPCKLEWQEEALRHHPQTDILFARLREFGDSHALHPHPASSAGLQDNAVLLREMYEADLIPAPTAVVRRSLHEALGRFDESLPSEDYEFWLRALRAGATFFYDDREMVRQRMHGGNLSRAALRIWEMNLHLRREYALDVADPALSKRLIARDLRAVARCRFGAEKIVGARDAYRESLRERPTLEAAAGAALLSVGPVAQALTVLNRRRPR